MSLELRSFRPADLGAVVRLFTDTVHHINAADYPPAQLRVWAPERPDLELWQERLEGACVWVAEVAGEIVGFAALGARGRLGLLYAHRLWQGKGIGSALLAQVEAEARRRGAVLLFVRASVTARPFFEHKGFRMLGERWVRREGLALRSYEMAKPLGPP